MLLAEHPQHFAQVVRHGLKATGLDPAHRLLVNDVVGGQIIRDHAPGTAGAHEPAQAVEYMSQLMVALRRVLFHERKIGCAEGPFFVGDITGISGFVLHPKLSTPNKDAVQAIISICQKLITGSNKVTEECSRRALLKSRLQSVTTQRDPFQFVFS